MVFDRFHFGVVLFSATLVGALAYVYATSSTSRRKKRNAKGVPGLRNLGSTCFANALLQCFASCDSFVEWIRKMNHNSPPAAYESLAEEPEKIDGDIIGELHRVLSKLNVAGGEDGCAAGVISALIGRRWKIAPNTEQDLFELFNVFVTSWEEQLAEVLPTQRPVSSLQLVRQVNEDCNAGLYLLPQSPGKTLPMSSDEQQQRPFNLIQQSPLSGLMGKQLQCCSCKRKRTRHDSFVAISVSIPKITGTPFITLESCLRRHFSTDIINGVKCDFCCSGDDNQKRVKCIQKHGISRFPNVLLVRIERVGFLPSGHAVKHSDHIAFPETLNLSDFVFYRTLLMAGASSANVDTQPTAQRQDSIVGGSTASIGANSSSIAPSSAVLQSAQFRFAAGDMGLQQPALISGSSQPSGVSASRRREYSYRLKAVAVHVGEPNRGHFVAYRRVEPRGSRLSNQWCYASDSDTRLVPWQTVERAEAYMLFYEKCRAKRVD